MSYFIDSIFDQWKIRGDILLGAKKPLEESCAVLAQSLQPTVADHAVRQAAVDRLNEVLPQIFPEPSDVRVLPFGSFRSSCFGRDSDLDLAITGTVEKKLVGLFPPGDTPKALTGLSNTRCADVLRHLADRLTDLGLTQGSVTRVLGDYRYVPRVPVIKFKEAATGISCDVSVNTNFSDFKSAFMELLHRHQPLLAPLVQLVKTWARHHRINSAPDHTFNSWTLELLAVWCCQTFPRRRAGDPPLIPPLWQVATNRDPSWQTCGGKRPLQGFGLTREKLEETLRQVAARLEERAATNRQLADTRGAAEAPSLLELFCWFLHCGDMLTGNWCNKPSAGPQKPCVSTWLGELCSCKDRFDWSYRAAVEDPFDYLDNTARTLGKGGYYEDHDNPLPRIARAFSASIEVLMWPCDTAGTERALQQLFGDAAVTLIRSAGSGAGCGGRSGATDADHVRTVSINFNVIQALLGVDAETKDSFERLEQTFRDLSACLETAHAQARASELPSTAASGDSPPSAASLTGASDGGGGSSTSTSPASSSEDPPTGTGTKSGTKSGTGTGSGSGIRSAALDDDVVYDDFDSESAADNVAEDLAYWLDKFTLTRKSKMKMGTRKARARVCS